MTKKTKTEYRTSSNYQMTGYYGVELNPPAGTRALEYGPTRTREAAQSGITRLLKKARVTASKTNGITNLTKALANPPAQKKTQNIIFVVDRSGSMQGIWTTVVEKLNKNIADVKQKAKETGIQTYISVLAFDTEIVRPLYFSDVNLVSYINPPGPRGGTALIDASIQASNDLNNFVENSTAKIKDTDYANLVYVLTDGQENESRNPWSALAATMKQYTATDRWTYTFLVPNGGKNFLVRNGVPEGNVMEWEQTTRGVQAYSAVTTTAFDNYYTARTNGQNKSTSFYTDLSNLSSTDVKKNLDDLSRNVKIFPVTKEQDIKTFVEEQLGTYKPGSAYYQLTKNEKVIQSYKKLLVTEKNSKKVYGGDDARTVLGFPKGDVRVVPGNHSNFDIFVQSTSNNRKLVRGTKLIVEL